MGGGLFLLGLLAVAIVFIIVATARWKLHPFLVLLITGYGIGVLGGLSTQRTIEALTGGFGSTLGYIGIVIAAGAIIGIILERSGGAVVMANTVVRWVGEVRSALAMTLTGAVVSIPVFCDSGFVVLSPLNRSLAGRTNQSMATYAVALSMGLYTTHVFVPPTPGPIAAAGELGANIGTVIMLGIVTTIPVLAVTYAFAKYMGERIWIDPDVELEGTDNGRSEESNHQRESGSASTERPEAWQAFAPVVLPIILIALQSIADLPARPVGEGGLYDLLLFLGDPNTALLIGVFVAFVTLARVKGVVTREWVGDGLKAAGSIILITGAGGALGQVLQATPLQDFLGEGLAGLQLSTFSILLPFIIAASLKTALGSSTVAIITTASILSSLLPSLGLDVGLGPVLATLAIGAGAMTVSHANDSYFWVVEQFSGMTVPQAYQLQTVGSAVAGITGIVTVFVLSLVLL